LTPLRAPGIYRSWPGWTGRNLEDIMDENHMVRGGRKYHAEEGTICLRCAFWSMRKLDCVLPRDLRMCVKAARADGRSIIWIDDGPTDEPDTIPAPSPALHPISAAWSWDAGRGGCLRLISASEGRCYDSDAAATAHAAWQACVEAARADGWVL
ncbi:MAG: hypothetical protein LLG45_03820, partial [Actinomycetia bacterium]|nr:hypothetical protein [Actinomycetes bacterium]